MSLYSSSNSFSSPNVYGLPGYVFGEFRHQKKGRKVPTEHPDWQHDVRIRWQNEEEKADSLNPDQPIISPHDMYWPMFASNLEKVARGLKFNIAAHCRDLCNQKLKQVVLEWGCGRGNAVKDLSLDPEIKGKALIYGYSDIWDVSWNEVEGVKFLFFVKEHMVEYFKRTRQRINFVFSHGAMEYLKYDDLKIHLEKLASIMDSGAKIVFSPDISSDIKKRIFWQLKDFHPSYDRSQLGSDLPCVLTRK